MIFAPALALIVDVFPRSQRGQALGMNALIVSLGVTAGPTLGGLITEALGWRWIFFVNVPLGLVGLLVARRVFRFGGGARPGGSTCAGAAAFGLGLGSLSLGLSFGAEWGWTSPALLLTLALAAGSLAAAVVVERRQRDPLVDLRQLVSRRLGLPLASFLFSVLALFAVAFLLPFYLEELRGLTPLAAGLLLTPYSLALAVAVPDLRAAGGPGSRPLARADRPWAGRRRTRPPRPGRRRRRPLAEIALWLAVSGIGQGLFLSPNTSAVMSAVPAGESGTASGLIAATRVVGQALSVAIAGAVFIGLGGAAAGAAMVAGGTAASTAQPALDDTFLGGDACRAARQRVAGSRRRGDQPGRTRAPNVAPRQRDARLCATAS